MPILEWTPLQMASICRATISCSETTLVTLCRVPEDRNLRQDRCENFKFRIEFIISTGKLWSNVCQYVGCYGMKCEGSIPGMCCISLPATIPSPTLGWPSLFWRQCYRSFTLFTHIYSDVKSMWLITSIHPSVALLLNLIKGNWVSIKNESILHCVQPLTQQFISIR